MEIGNFIQGQYKFGCIAGSILKINKNTVIIEKCHLHYKQCLKCKVEVSVTKSRISEIHTSIEAAGFTQVDSITR